jgi:uncharacterized membrane protein YuzA (DUF378 family)
MAHGLNIDIGGGDGSVPIAPEGDLVMSGPNESNLDRVIRVVVGIAALALFFVGPRTPWGLLGLVPLITGIVGVCPLYRLVGLSTCSLPARRGT